jgi:transcriptional antiterminator Rof (Rho-off)
MPLAYHPIACSLHDQYLAWATLRIRVNVEHVDALGAVQMISGVIVDVHTRSEDAAEWMVIGDHPAIRLDRIVSARPANG